jgi:hypothetical protein
MAAGCASTGDGPGLAARPETVRAQRYTILYVESAMDASHGGGTWVEELYFPIRRVACTLRTEGISWQDMAKEGGELQDLAILDAFPADGPRNDLTGFHGKGPSAIQEVEVPRTLAEEIFALADMGVRQRELSHRIGISAVRAGILRQSPPEPSSSPLGTTPPPAGGNAKP